MEGWLEAASRAIWGWPTALGLALGGAALLWAGDFAAIRRFPFAMRRVLGGLRRRRDGVSPFEALCTAVAGTVGTGNIAGVAVAVSMGGAGAVFWMWASAVIGMGTKFAEIVLAVRFRERRGDTYIGGPMYTVKNGLPKRFGFLAMLFCVSGAAAAFGIGNLTQIGSIMTALDGAAGIFRHGARLGKASRLAVGIAMAAVCHMLISGGDKGRGRAAARLVPLMALIYAAGAISVIAVNVRRVPLAFGEIISGALSKRAIASGAAGSALSWGMRRGLFSNEAGLGSSPIAHASAETASPVEQGFWGIFEVFIDTIALCTLTALMLLVSGVPLPKGSGAEAVTAALAAVFGSRGAAIYTAAAMALFGVTSMVGWSLYGERCAEYLFGSSAVKPYRAVFVLAAAAAPVVSFTAAIRLSDIMTALMILPNMAAALMLIPVLRKEVRGYFGQQKAPGPK